MEKESVGNSLVTHGLLRGCVRDPVRSREELNQRAKNRMAVRSGEERALAVNLLLE